MEEIAKTIGRLIGVLLARGILNDNDKAYICDEISIDEWIEREI